MWLRSFLPLAILLASTQMLAAQVIRGNLLDDETGRPLEAGTVSLLTRDSTLVSRIQTDSAGAFRLTLTGAGSYRVGAERLGYIAAISPTLTLGARDTFDVEFRLSTRSVVLEPLVVTARRRISGQIADFYDRAERGAWGTFITRAEIDRIRPHNTTDLLRTIPGIHLHPRRLGGGHHVTLRGNCRPAVYIDGTLVPLYSMTMDDLMSAGDLEGIEVYRSGAEAPVQYQRDAGCGAILLWSRLDL